MSPYAHSASLSSSSPSNQRAKYIDFGNLARGQSVDFINELVDLGVESRGLPFAQLAIVVGLRPIHLGVQGEILIDQGNDFVVPTSLSGVR